MSFTGIISSISNFSIKAVSLIPKLIEWTFYAAIIIALIWVVVWVVTKAKGEKKE